MWLKWFPWRFIVKKMAKSHGFLDPVPLLSKFQNFAQPSEVAAPIELLRLATVLQARGLINSQAIQHNLDWVWPFWVKKQFDPKDLAFVPRAFSLTHINLTHRNWTAVGIPDTSDYALVDPRGLVTPFYDGWSLDAMIYGFENEILIPSQVKEVMQTWVWKDTPEIQTVSELSKSLFLISSTSMIEEDSLRYCRIVLRGQAHKKSHLVISLRPYNPEGVSFVHDISLLEQGYGWRVNKKQWVYFKEMPDQKRFSTYHQGDVLNLLKNPRFAERASVNCPVGMATAAFVYELKPDEPREIEIQIPLETNAEKKPLFQLTTPSKWPAYLKGICQLQVPEEKFEYLFQASIQSLILHSPEEVFPGPYTYKHFWFRDAAFILKALLSLGLEERTEKALDHFPKLQKANGHFCSQDGEWDSNGQALWIMDCFCRMSGKLPKKSWQEAILKAAHWIHKKRLPEKKDLDRHAGLFPPGFSAEHLGPNDYYYWDDFWGVQGLRSASRLLRGIISEEENRSLIQESNDFLEAIEKSLQKTSLQLGTLAMPSSPYRRLDTASIGSLAAGYPLKLWEPENKRLLATVNYLLENCFVRGGFFHDMAHSGINPYLCLHIAQILLRAGDLRFWKIVKNVANFASPTGQWPEAIHPHTLGGCMGDGQHVWASAEWVLMMRHCFLREEGENLILASGIPQEWLETEKELLFGPASTLFGKIRIRIQKKGQRIQVEWETGAAWKNPKIFIQFPGKKIHEIPNGKNDFEMMEEAQ